jgi:hypothetical protein
MAWLRCDLSFQITSPKGKRDYEEDPLVGAFIISMACLMVAQAPPEAGEFSTIMEGKASKIK